MKSKNDILERIYNLSGEPEACVDAYKDWATTYDQDTVDGMNYVGPRVAAERLAGLLEPDATVLDAGCGTGLAGVELAGLGFKTIDGMDISPDMLDEARKKGPYRHLKTEDMTGALSYKRGAYDAVICVGIFTHAHVGPKGFNELVRVTRPGGPIVATVHEDVWPDGYDAHFKALEADGLASVQSISDEAYHINRCKLVTLECR
jgi:2-polyprenyl-3-methyl-5-hydroxy-6-metoxy-1,4-benzoquinol methylase